MATQGAVQIDVTIRGKSLTILKKNVVSLSIKRVIGDAADEFTLEVFDETAFRLENHLAGGGLAPITVKYSCADDFGKSYIFSGTCLNYQMSFVGMSAMLTIEGILSVSSGDSTDWCFTAQNIEWVGDFEDRASDEDKNNDKHDWWVDGKSEAEYLNWKDNEDVCAILDFKDSEGNKTDTPTVYYNPSRIFKRIMHTYNESKLGTVNGVAASGWGTGGNGKFEIGKDGVDESRWVAGIRRCQENETTSQYITNVLCKSAITCTSDDYKNETAGFKYYVSNGKHFFKALDYNKPSNCVNITYGKQNSSVISFSTANIGSVIMAAKEGDEVTAASATDYLTNDSITANGENILDVQVSEEEQKENQKVYNWYMDGNTIRKTNISVKSSSSKSELGATATKAWKALSSYTMSAELTVWAKYSNQFVPGGYIDIIVMGAEGRKHYSSGVYMIVKIDDNISSEGYTQTLTLLKHTGETKKSDSGKYQDPEIMKSDGTVTTISAVPEKSNDSQPSTSIYSGEVTNTTVVNTNTGPSSGNIIVV